MPETAELTTEPTEGAEMLQEGVPALSLAEWALRRNRLKLRLGILRDADLPEDWPKLALEDEIDV